MSSDSEANDLYEKMCEARREWEFASESFKRAAQLSQELERESGRSCFLKSRGIARSRDPEEIPDRGASVCNGRKEQQAPLGR